MALAWLRREAGAVGWALALVVLTAWMGLGGVPVLGLALFVIATIAAFVWIPGLVLLLVLYWRSRPGRIRQPRRAFWIVVSLPVVYAVLWLTVLPTDFGDIPEVLALFVPNAVVFLALAERAEAYGKPRLVEAAIGVLGAYVALLPFFDDARHMPGLVFGLALVALVALQALPMRLGTRVAIALGIVPVAWGLPDVTTTWEMRIVTEAVVVVAYALGLVLARRWLPRARALPSDAAVA